MVGVLRESHYHIIRKEYESEQKQLSAYTEDDSPTTIAVVSCPRDTGIETMCDEWWPELGMPEHHLERFWNYRAGFKSNSAVDNPTERAYDEARLDYWYDRHVRNSESAQKALNGLVSRLENGEDVTLVCFEKPCKPCHRYKLKEIVETRLSSEYQFRQRKLTA